MWSRSLALALLLLPAPALAAVKENVAARAPQGLVLVRAIGRSCYRRLTESKSNCDSDFPADSHGRLMMCRRR
jgi:hypothetical protein